MIGARRFFVAAGMALRSVTMACASAEPHLQCVPRGSLANHFADGALHVLRVFAQIREDFLERDRIVLRVPAIVIGDHGEGSVAKFGFAGELGFGEIGHADHVETELAVGVRFGEGRKLRAFHAHVCAPAMSFHAGAFARVREMGREMRAGGFVETDMRDDAAAEESGDAAARTVEKLVGNQEIERRKIVAKRAHRAHGNDALDADHFQGADVRAIIDLARRKTMAASMAGEKSDAAAFERAGNDRVRRIAEGCLHANFAPIGKAGHRIEAAAADNADFRPFLLAPSLFCLRHSQSTFAGSASHWPSRSRR